MNLKKDKEQTENVQMSYVDMPDAEKNVQVHPLSKSIISLLEQRSMYQSNQVEEIP